MEPLVRAPAAFRAADVALEDAALDAFPVATLDFPPLAPLFFLTPPAPFFVEEERPAEVLAFEAFPDADLVRVDLESAFDALPFGAFVRLDLESFEDVALEGLPRADVLDVFAGDNLDFDPLPMPDFELFVNADFVVFPRTLGAPLPVAAGVFSPFVIF